MNYCNNSHFLFWVEKVRNDEMMKSTSHFYSNLKSVKWWNDEMKKCELLEFEMMKWWNEKCEMMKWWIIREFIHNELLDKWILHKWVVAWVLNFTMCGGGGLTVVVLT